MRFITCIIVALALVLAVAGEQQRILRRVIKSTPTASNLARVRLVTVRSASAESGAVAEISSKEAASFGQRSANETNSNQNPQLSSAGLKTKAKPSPASTSTTTSTTTTTTSAPSTTGLPQPSSTTSAAATVSSTTSKQVELKHRASDRQQAESQPAAEIELLASAPSSWQSMTAVEAPAALLIATGTRPASSDLASSSSEESASSDFLRSSSSTKGSYTQHSDDFSRVRQQQQQNQQQSFFYPQTSRASKTSKSGTKTNWYQPPASTTTTPRPAPIIQQEQQFEQYVEQQQQQVEYGAAPQGQAEPFAFDFKTQDNSGNGQYRKEESDKNGVVRGSYGYTDASGIYRHVEYVADENGFRANIKSNEPGLIGETQPASIQLSGGASPSRLSSQPQAGSGTNNDEWTASSSSNHQASSDLALAPPDFESSHRSDRLRSPRHFRN